MANQTDALLTHVRHLLTLSDEELAILYSEWSEDTWAAGWMGDAEEQFVRETLDAGPRARPLADYQIESIAKIRGLLRALADGRGEG